jgi:hypothetical protein
MQIEGTTAKSLRKEMRFPVNLTSKRHFIIEKLMNFAGWLSQGRWQIVSSQRVDALHSEIYQLEKTLANAPTRPTRTVRNSRPLEPVTEQQKIVDLAG